MAGVALALAGVSAWGNSRTAEAGTPRVVIVDNDSKIGQQGFDEDAGYFAFTPSHLEVEKGTKVVFDNPAGNFRPHDIVSLERDGGSFDNKLVAGAKFASSPTRESVITPGNQWVLDTAEIPVGHYAYYCSIHPWMVGSLTVSEPSAPGAAPAQ
jgi:plastocyanin